MGRVLEEAQRFAKVKHFGQKDDNGLDYFKAHLLPVSLIVGIVTDDEDVVAAAYLHDTIEDTSTTYDELKKVFGRRIADLVLEVTHEGQKDEKGYYFPRLRSRDAILIKFADRLSNISRMQNWTTERQAHYLKRSKFWKTE